MSRPNLQLDAKSGTIPRWINKTRIGVTTEDEEVEQQEESREKNNNVKGIFKNLQEIYYNPLDPGSFGGIERLYQRAKKLEIERNNEEKNSNKSKQRTGDKEDCSQRSSETLEATNSNTGQVT